MSSDDDEYNPVEEVVRRAEPIPEETKPDPPQVQKTECPPSSVSLKTELPSLAEPLEEEEGGLRLHSDIASRVRDVCMSPSGNILCAVSDDGYFCMWDFTVPLESKRLTATRTLTPFVNRIAGLQSIVAVHAATDSSYFIACQDGDSPVMIGAKGKQLGYCAAGERGLMDVVQCRGHRGPVTSSSADRTDVKHFFTASQDGTARRWSESQFEKKSMYVVKHGSGQITDTVTVEGVLGLSAAVGNGLFSTSGADGLVQLWDTRVKYRPGGSAASWDVHALRYGETATAPAVSASRRKTVDPFAPQKHTGGMCEMEGGVPALVVRMGESVKVLDLRKPFSKGGTLLHPPLNGLPSAMDTMNVNGNREGTIFATCTSRAGYEHVVGGHVVQYSVTEEGIKCVSKWKAGRPTEDALCVCSGKAGELYCGLSTGVVVVHPDPQRDASIYKWLSTRPTVEHTTGAKRSRPELDDVDEPIF